MFLSGGQRKNKNWSEWEGGCSDSQRSLVRPSVCLSGSGRRRDVDGAKRRARHRGPTAMFRDDDRTTDRLDATSGLQGSAKKLVPGCVNAAGRAGSSGKEEQEKLHQKWSPGAESCV